MDVDSLRQAVSNVRASLEYHRCCVIRELMKPNHNRFYSSQDVDRHEEGIKYCDMYLKNSINIEELLVSLDDAGFYDQLKYHLTEYLSKDLVEKYIGYDEID